MDADFVLYLLTASRVEPIYLFHHSEAALPSGVYSRPQRYSKGITLSLQRITGGELLEVATLYNYFSEKLQPWPKKSFIHIWTHTVVGSITVFLIIITQSEWEWPKGVLKCTKYFTPKSRCVTWRKQRFGVPGGYYLWKPNLSFCSLADSLFPFSPAFSWLLGCVWTSALSGALPFQVGRVVEGS